MEKQGIEEVVKYFEGVETTESHDGYYYSVGEAIAIVILGSFCGLRNVNQIHQWATHDKNREILQKNFNIERVPCYFWLLRLLKILNPKSMSECFTRWVESLLPERLDAQGKMAGYTVALDGKTVRSTDAMERYENPLHIVSAQISELGLTFGQEAVDGKSNEIPAAQRLIKALRLKGCMVVADALNCQKDTAKAIRKQQADYLLSVKDNHATLKKDIEDYVQDADCRKEMETSKTRERSRDRIETRTAFVTTDVGWLEEAKNWSDLCCIGAIHTEFAIKKGKTSEWHYYISNRALSPDELCKHARAEWSVETMHWLLDVHFSEDFCRVQDENVQLVLNMVRKIVLNVMRLHKSKTGSKRPFSHIMLDCLIDPLCILSLLRGEN